jgi:elongation factor G
MMIGQAVPSQFIQAIEKGFIEAKNSGSLIGHPVENLRVVLTDGASHAVDSSELAFKLAALYAFRQCYMAARPAILEPIMLVELKAPIEFQGSIIGDINRRKGIIVGSDQDGDDAVVQAHVSTTLSCWSELQYVGCSFCSRKIPRFTVFHVLWNSTPFCCC